MNYFWVKVDLLIGIYNPDVWHIRICNPIIALQMLIFIAWGLQIPTSELCLRPFPLVIINSQLSIAFGDYRHERLRVGA